jgi:hypothetical protein
MNPRLVLLSPCRFATTLAFVLGLGMWLVGSAPKAKADLHDGLVLHLTFDGDVADHTGRGNDGTIVRPGPGSPYVPGIIGQAFQTMGSVTLPDSSSGNIISLGSPTDLKFGGGTRTDFSISFWGQYLTGAQHDDIPWLSNKDWISGSNRGWVIASEGGGTVKWNFRSKGETRRDSPHVGGGLDDGQWHHYAITFSAGGDGAGIIYLDGALVDYTPTNSVLDVDFVFPTIIFQDGTMAYTDTDSGANWDQAAIDDLGIWRRAISDTEVAVIYTMGLAGQSALSP